MPTDQEIAQIARRIVDGLCRDLFERMPVLSAPRLVAESREFKDFKVEKAEAVAGVLKAMLNDLSDLETEAQAAEFDSNPFVVNARKVLAAIKEPFTPGLGDIRVSALRALVDQLFPF